MVHGLDSPFIKSKMFITLQDFDLVVQKEIREMTIDNEKLLDIAKSVTNSVRGQLAKKFNVTEIFIQEGENRDIELVEYICDISIYKAFKSIAPDLIPETKIDAFDYAKEWLSKITLPGTDKDVMYCNLPLNKNFGNHDNFIGGSDRKFRMDF